MWVVGRDNGAVDLLERPSPWRIDPGLAGELSARLGWDPGDGVPALVSALARWMPAGSTAKLEAIAAREDPPGADAGSLARDLLDSLTSGVAQPSWSCWARATVMAALIETPAVGRADVAVTRRLDAADGVVDFHSAVSVVDADGSSWLTDPHFGGVMPGPGEDETRHEHLGIRARRRDQPDGRWAYELEGPRWKQMWHYQEVGRALDAADVLAFCRVSVLFSGVPDLRSARLVGPDWVVSIREDDEGRIWWNEWQGPHGPVDPEPAASDGSARGLAQSERASWSDACADFASVTGVAVR